ncbi:hypothetical protein NPIL_410721 [Nephila pilipes]|uniref:Uncharacterized protein n=1 Tax=Nephila pilipes TaxID=299642 RepID=A0A8X6MY77_NEPPI|nr:hypothetical protein NPIL_46881 [Nephila pilipes]GFT41796.1 hypothetical protein NPIL_410721 [Nephila pilipes]
MLLRSLKLSNQPRLVLNPSQPCDDSPSVSVTSCLRSWKMAPAFSQIIASETESPANCFSLIHNKSSCSISSCILVHSFEIMVTPLEGCSFFIASFCLMIVDIVEGLRPYSFAR